MITRIRLVLIALAIVALPVHGWMQIQLPTPVPPRTFPQFAGTWMLDEAASTGRLTITPRISRQLTITTSPEAITLDQLLRLNPSDDPAREKAAPAIYRFDGSETTQADGRSLRFMLVADALALTTTQHPKKKGDNTSIVTDALSVDGNVLTFQRQLYVVDASGHIPTMQEPTNNFRHTYIYRRASN
jgi:hypothetical protein